MLLNNTKHNTFFQYSDIQFADGYWYAWYYVDIGSDDLKVLEQGDDATKKGSVNG